MFSTTTSGALVHAQGVASSLKRSIRHADSEYIVPFSTAAVMETVSADSSLTWSNSLAWVAPRFGETGRLSFELATDRAGVTEHYTWVQGAGERDRYDLNARLATDWWVIWDSEWRGVSPYTGERVETEAFSLHFTDGDGISGEMTSLRLDPPLNQSHAERVQLFKDYFAAVESGDVDDLMAKFSPDGYVGSAVRTYFGAGEGGVSHLAELAQLRQHFVDLYDHATVRSITVTNWYIRDWYLFAEVLWDVELRDGSRMGMQTAEVLLLAPDGRLAGRVGHGTRMEPLGDG